MSFERLPFQLKLSDSEQKELNELQRLIESSDEKDQEIAEQRISQFFVAPADAKKMTASQRVVKYAFHGDAFDTFCQAQDKLKDIFTKRLVAGKNPHFPIASLTKDLIVTTFSQFKGVVLYVEYEACPDKTAKGAIELLDTACDCYSYYALLARLKASVTKLTVKNTDAKSNENIDEKAFHTLLQDAITISHVYRTVGYINAANVLFDVAATLFKVSGPMQTSNFSWKDKFKDMTGCPQYMIALKAAVCYLYMAQKLETDAVSKELMKLLLPAEGLFAGYEGSFAKTWEGLYQHHLAILRDNFKVPAPETFCAMAEADVVEELQTFDVELPEQVAASANKLLNGK